MASHSVPHAAEAPSPSSLVPLLQRIMELQGKPDPTEAERADLSRLETEWSNYWLTDRQDIPSRPPSVIIQSKTLAGINERVLLDLVDDERDRLFNVLASIRCIRAALGVEQSPDADEFERAIDLVTAEIDRVIDALEQVPLLRAARKATAEAEKLRAGSNASVRAAAPEAWT